MEYLGMEMGMGLLLLVVWTSSQAEAYRYKVGDSVWSIPPTQTYYSNWSSRHHFFIHDLLCFEFDTGSHDVLQVSKLDFDACSSSNPYRTYRSGPAQIRLTHKGVLYFICNVSDYCLLGQKIAVPVDDPPGRNVTVSPWSSAEPPGVAQTPTTATTESGPRIPIPSPERHDPTLRGALIVVILMVVVCIVVCT